MQETVTCLATESKKGKLTAWFLVLIVPDPDKLRVMPFGPVLL